MKMLYSNFFLIVKIQYIQNQLNSNYLIKISDFSNNSISISIPIKGDQLEILEPKIIHKTEDFIYAQESSSITKGKFNIYIPANSFYEDTYLSIVANVDTIKLHEDIIPLHKNISIATDVSNYNKTDIDKLYIGRLNYKKTPYYVKTYRKGNKLTAKTKGRLEKINKAYTAIVTEGKKNKIKKRLNNRTIYILKYYKPRNSKLMR